MQSYPDRENDDHIKDKDFVSSIIASLYQTKESSQKLTQDNFA